MTSENTKNDTFLCTPEKYISHSSIGVKFWYVILGILIRRFAVKNLLLQLFWGILIKWLDYMCSSMLNVLFEPPSYNRAKPVSKQASLRAVGWGGGALGCAHPPPPLGHRRSAGPTSMPRSAHRLDTQWQQPPPFFSPNSLKSPLKWIYWEGGVDSERLAYRCLKGEYILGGLVDSERTG